MLIDTHAHLYWEDYKEDLDEVIQHSFDAGVTTVINVGVDVEKSKMALKQVQGELAKIKGISFYSTIGIHPHESLRYTQGKHSNIDVSIHQDIERLEQLYQNNPGKVIAVGECGLDFYFREEDPSVPFDKLRVSQDDIISMQKKLFQAQIDLAKKLNLPLIVHTRDDRSKNPQNSEAWDAVLEMIGNHPAILHCYSGLSHTANHILQTTNLLVSFAGTITYPKNEYLRQAAKVLPLEKICLETDCPFLPPQSKRGQRNEPANVLEIAQLIADLKDVSLEKVCDQTTANVARIFAFPS